MRHKKATRETKYQLIENKWLFNEGKINHLAGIEKYRIVDDAIDWKDFAFRMGEIASNSRETIHKRKW